MFDLSTDHPRAYLYHGSALGEFYLSSDGLGHTYRHVKAMKEITSEMPEEEMDEFFSVCSTIGAYIIFPSNRIDGKRTINGARGLDHKIRDRFDLTLECIRRHYVKEASPLSEVLVRYSDFFDLFESFSGYVDFFLLQDLVDEESGSVRFFHPFQDFGVNTLPSKFSEYRSYRDAVTAFVVGRNKRIADFIGGQDQ